VRAYDGRRIGPEERLVVVRAVVDGETTVDYSLSNAAADVPLADVVRARAQRFRIEQMLEEGKGEAGLAHYEVRGWVGWHHHMTLALLALWFLLLERGRLGGKRPTGRGTGGGRAGDTGDARDLPGRHGPAGPGHLLRPAP